VAPPRLPTRLDTAPTDLKLDHEGRYADLHLHRSGLAHTDARLVELARCRLDNVDLSMAVLERAGFTDCRFGHCDLANAELSEANVTRVAFHDVRMTGGQMAGGVVTDVTFESCRLDLTGFRFTRFRRVVFRGCVLSRADFQGADLRSAQFVDCDLNGAQFSNVRADGASFQQCLWEGVGGVASLRGATIRTDDLLSLSYTLARALGIRVDTG
jgi:uncharacterized protein YjbI with pentapeptide repeats